MIASVVPSLRASLSVRPVVPESGKTRPVQAGSHGLQPATTASVTDATARSADRVDKSARQIETAQQAASVPALNPAVLSALIPYAVSASIGGYAMQASLHLTLGATQGDVVYRMDDPAHPSLQAVGTLDDHTFKETWTMDDQGLHIVGSYGSTPEELRLSRDADGYRLDGHVGDYPVQQRVTWTPSSQQLTFDGTLGTLPYRQTVAIHNNPSMPETNATGALGSDATAIGYMAMPDHTRTSIDVSADGNLIGQRLEMEGTVKLMPPGTHPKVNLAGTLQVDGSPTGTVKPGQPSHWQLKFHDATTNVPVLEYELEHEKYMHLVAVSRDLSTFAHVHPTFDPQYGHFDIDINKASADPDNQDAAAAVTRPGPTLVWAEMKPKNQDVTTRAFTVAADGVENATPLTPDVPQADGTIRKYFTADGQPGKAGDRYQVTLSIAAPQLTYKLQQATADGYADVTDLQPWLGMMGHAIVIGAAGDTVDQKFFAHLHAGHDHGRHPSTGPDEVFTLPSAPPAGVYKIWGQFKHADRVLTLPFVFSLASGAESSSNGAAA